MVQCNIISSNYLYRAERVATKLKSIMP